MKAPESKNGIPVFTEQSFLRPEDKVYIHMSSEYPDFVGVLHSHEYIEIVYILSGSAKHVVGDSCVTAQKGDLFIINPDVPHAFYGNTDSKETFCAYDLMFVPDFIDVDLINGGDFTALGSSYLFYSMFPQEKAVGADLHLSNNSYSDFGELFNKIYMEHRGQEKGYLEIIRAYLLQLIITIFRMDDSSNRQAGLSRNRQAVNYIQDYIRMNYMRPISVQELADRVYLSRDYVGRLFRDATGMTITAMIQKVRIDHVCEMLTATDRTIVDIAASCGFEDMKFFYSVFKKQKGMLPADYRRQG